MTFIRNQSDRSLNMLTQYATSGHRPSKHTHTRTHTNTGGRYNKLILYIYKLELSVTISWYSLQSAYPYAITS